MRPNEDFIIAATLPRTVGGRLASFLDIVLQSSLDESYFGGAHQHLFRASISANILGLPLDDEVLNALLLERGATGDDILKSQILFRDLLTLDVSAEKVKVLIPAYKDYVHAGRMAGVLEDAVTVLTEGAKVDGEWLEGYKPARTLVMTRLAELDAKDVGVLPTKDIRATADELLAEYERAKNNTERGILTGFHEIDSLTNGIQKGELWIFCAYTGEGKALALDTPIATPSGWSTMGAMQVGDTIFDERGRQTRVTFVSGAQQDRRCYRVEFSDGEAIIADAEHLWAVRRWMWGADRPLEVLTTEQMAANVLQSGRPRYAIPAHAALQLPDATLPLDPYVLGLWLGDITGDERDEVLSTLEAQFPRAVRFGRQGNAATLRLEPKLAPSALCKRGHTRKQYGHTLQCPTCAKLHARAARGGDALDPLSAGAAMQPVTAALRGLGLIQNKHVPAAYLRASADQRLALLQGLMDSDGYVSVRGPCEFVSMSEPLARGVEELARSLGIKTGWTTGRAMLRGKHCGTKYRVRWTSDVPVFRMQRKAERLAHTRPDIRTRRRYITAITAVDSVPVQCIQVDSPNRLFLAGRSMVPTHNTQLLLNTAYHAVVHQKKNVAFVSMEMPLTQVRRRMIARHSNHPTFGMPGGLDYVRIKDGKLDPAEEQLYGQVITDWKNNSDYGIPIVLQISKAENVKTLAERLLYIRSRTTIDLLVLDYASLLSSVRRRSDRRDEIVEVVEGLKALALTFNEGEGLACITANQVSRKAREEAESLKKYGLNFASETSAIEKNADLLAWLLRLDEHKQNKEVLMGVAKYRDGDIGREFTLMERYESSLLTNLGPSRMV